MVVISLVAGDVLGKEDENFYLRAFVPQLMATIAPAPAPAAAAPSNAIVVPALDAPVWGGLSSGKCRFTLRCCCYV